ncbi:unnamed protein product, partial [Coregonus sp. 'balchen']
PLRAVAVLLLVGFIWVLASSILGGDSNSVKHLAFRVVSGAANVIGPKICLEDKILVSRVNNNVGRGLNVALGYVESSWTQSFDTWAGGALIGYILPVSDVTDLLKYLLPLQEGTLVLNDEARHLFEELGSTAVKELTFRDSWVFVGAKGIENKSPFEQNSNKYEGWPGSLEMDGCIPLRSPSES